MNGLVPNQAVKAVRPEGVLWFAYPKLTGAMAADINRDTAARLAVAWTWKPGEQPIADVRTQPGSFENTPLMIDNVLYVSTPYNRVVALDPGSGRGQWRVIAFTYNRESQAQQKAGSLAQSRPELRPEVFTPNGHAPYLVALGGTMSRDEAFALARKARGEGLPHDIYAQNYRGSGR